MQLVAAFLYSVSMGLSAQPVPGFNPDGWKPPTAVPPIERNDLPPWPPRPLGRGPFFEHAWVQWEPRVHTRGEDKKGDIELSMTPSDGWAICSYVAEEVSNMGGNNSWWVAPGSGNTLRFHYEVETACTALGMYCPKSSVSARITAYTVKPTNGSSLDEVADAINKRRPRETSNSGRGVRQLVSWPDSIKCDFSGHGNNPQRRPPLKTTQLFPQEEPSFMASLDVE